MGLDTSHDCFHGAYSAFTRWRNEVAKAAGYWVVPVKWPDMGYETESVLLEWHRYEDRNFKGEWDDMPADPLILLIVHSDADGEIKPEHCVPLADRLEGLLPKLDGEGAGHIAARGGFRGVTEKFIAGLRKAAAAGEPVYFHCTASIAASVCRARPLARSAA
jgi:hypothetical protein